MDMKHGATNPRHDGEEPHAPPRLVAALKELPSRRVFVPPAIDETVLHAAQRQLAGPRRGALDRILFLRWWPALAAACLLVLGLMLVLLRPLSSPSRFAREDLNHDGQVDILDAFQLAREVRSGTRPPSSLDLNGDGVVDARDAAVIARQAVELGKGGRS